MRRLVGSSAARVVVAVVVGVALLGGAFYAGRVYQNNADQKLFAEYNPPQPSSGGRGTGFGGGAGASSFSASGGFGGSSQNAQINAALSVGNPPSDASSASGNGSSGASGSGTNGASTNGAGAGATGQGAAATGRRALTGQLVSATGGKLTVQSFLGQQSLPTTAQTRFFRVVSASASALAVGQRVAISPDPSDSTTASSITIAPPGNLYVRVRSFGGNAGGFGGANGSGGSRNGGGFGSGGSNGGGFGSGGGGFGSGNGGGGFGSGSSGGSGGNGTGGNGAGFGRGGGLTGTITAVSNGSVTIKTAPGASQTIKRTAATAVYRAVPSTGTALKTGLFISARSATVGGHQVAVDVVQAASSGAIASIVAGS